MQFETTLIVQCVSKIDPFILHNRFQMTTLVFQNTILIFLRQSRVLRYFDMITT